MGNNITATCMNPDVDPLAKRKIRRPTTNKLNNPNRMSTSTSEDRFGSININGLTIDATQIKELESEENFYDDQRFLDRSYHSS